MIVEKVEEEPPSLGLSTFNEHLDNVEHMLRRMERYSLKLNVQISDIKNLVATNRRAITRLQENEQRMKFLLEDSLNSLDNQVESRKESSLTDCEQSVAKLEDNIQKEQPSDERLCHLRRTCKVTNIQEISWTQCKPSTEDGLEEEKPHRKAKMLLTLLEKDLDQEGGVQNGQSSVDLKQQQALIEKVNCILKMIENLDLKIGTIEKVKQVCKRALIAMFERQKELSFSGLSTQKSGKLRRRCEQKVVKSNLAVFSQNPYL